MTGSVFLRVYRVSRIAYRESGIDNPSSVISHPSSVISHPSSVLSPLHLSRTLYKSTLFMQNKPNSYHGLPARGSLLSVCNINRYVNVRPVGLPENEPKNEPKRTQNEPNFSPKLGSFSTKLALFYKEFFAFAKKSNLRKSVKLVLSLPVVSKVEPSKESAVNKNSCSSRLNILFVSSGLSGLIKSVLLVLWNPMNRSRSRVFFTISLITKILT